MEIRNIPEMKDVKVSIKDENEITRKHSLRNIIISAVIVMIISGIGSYIYCTKTINSGYTNIVEVEIGKDGTSIESLAKAFIPDLNTKIAVRMIVKQNGYGTEDPLLRRGQIVKIPTKYRENPVLVKPYMIKTKITDFQENN